MVNYYDVLGISIDAPQESIREAFRRQAKQKHPDTASGAQSEMVLLNLAYETLRDPDRRRAYDERLHPIRKLPKRPTTGAGDPLQFLTKTFQPLDHRLRTVLSALEEALTELAYDLYDDAYVAAFAEAVEQSEAALAESSNALHRNEWPRPWQSALSLYAQGLRQVEDALQDFASFPLNYDSDALVQGRSLLAGGLELMGEARDALRMP